MNHPKMEKKEHRILPPEDIPHNYEEIIEGLGV